MIRFFYRPAVILLAQKHHVISQYILCISPIHTDLCGKNSPTETQQTPILPQNIPQTISLMSKCDKAINKDSRVVRCIVMERP